MRFISIDSSLSHTGWAVGTITESIGLNSPSVINIEAIGLITTESETKKLNVRASSDTVRRCRKTVYELTDVMDTYKPEIIFAETPTGSQSANAMKSYGATCQLIAFMRPDPIEVSPTEAKIAATGNKTASKEDIIRWAYDKYPNLEWHTSRAGIDVGTAKLARDNEHIADAIAIAHAGIKTPEYQRLKSVLNGN